MILLTGATGFLGSRLLDQLLKRGEHVVAVKRTTSSLSRIQHCVGHPLLNLFDVDVEDPRILFKRHRIDTIVHTATEYGRQDNSISKILEANLILPIRLIELGIGHGMSCFINTDSYFNKVGRSYSNLLNYSLSKGSLLTWLKQFSGRIRVINVILEHLYGPGDSCTKFVEDLIQKIAVEQAPRVALTHGHQRRDFIYIDDAAAAFIKLINYGRSHEFSFESFELGTGRSVQVRDFAQLVKQASNSSAVLGFGDIDYRPDEMMDSRANLSALSELGWSPEFTLDRGITSILEYYGAAPIWGREL